MSQFDCYWSEEAWRQANDPTYQDRLPMYGLVTKWPEEGESVVHAQVDGESYYWRAVKAFAQFVSNQPKHGKQIADVYWQGDPSCWYAHQVAYIAGNLPESEIPAEWKDRFAQLPILNTKSNDQIQG